MIENTTAFWLVAALLLVAAMALFSGLFAEHFTTKREKAEALASWWAQAAAPTYRAYKAGVEQPDVIDYMAVKAAKDRSPAAIERLI